MKGKEGMSGWGAELRAACLRQPLLQRVNPPFQDIPLQSICAVVALHAAFKAWPLSVFTALKLSK
jgi:hypothetical protein